MRIAPWRLGAGLAIVAGLCVFASCEDAGVQPDGSRPQEYGTVRGVVQFWVGDFQCCPVEVEMIPVPRELCFHAATKSTQADREGYGGFYNAIHTELIAVVESACNTGYFEVRLPVGTYSVFVVEDISADVFFYSNRHSGEGWINPVEVLPNTTTDFVFRITYATSS